MWLTGRLLMSGRLEASAVLACRNHRKIISKEMVVSYFRTINMFLRLKTVSPATAKWKSGNIWPTASKFFPVLQRVTPLLRQDSPA